jgi:hypothetical protein
MLSVCTTNLNMNQYRKCTYNPNIEARSRNYFAVEKQKLLHIPSMSVALHTKHEKRMRLVYIVICCLSGCIFFHITSKAARLSYVLIFCTNFVWDISHSKKNWARYYHTCT